MPQVEVGKCKKRSADLQHNVFYIVFHLENLTAWENAYKCERYGESTLAVETKWENCDLLLCCSLVDLRNPQFSARSTRIIGGSSHTCTGKVLRP